MNRQQDDGPRADAIVVHSGGMDSSLCLALAVRRFGADNVLSMSFRYGQRHAAELGRARAIARALGVRNTVVPLDCLTPLTESALLDPTADIYQRAGAAPNTAVVGRNGLLARLAAIHAHHLGARHVYLGVIEVESANSGYPDCSRAYMDKLQEILRLDLQDGRFCIETPLVHMTKEETMELAHGLGILAYLLETTITCYRGVDKQGCMDCPACTLRNAGIASFMAQHPDFDFSYREALRAAYVEAAAPRALAARPR